jgi:hypothetical protein
MKLSFEKSFASHEKSKYWNYDLNIDIPKNVRKSSNKKYWFKCTNGNHLFEKQLNYIIDGNWCPYPCCAGQKLCSDENCKICFETSFASSSFLNKWNYELNKENPRMITKHNHKSYWFNCDKSSHIYKSKINSISNGSTCPYPCCKKSPMLLCTDENCKICFETSFASSQYIDFWDNEKNTENPRMVCKKSRQKYWFKCKKHSFYKEVYSVSRGNLCSFKCCTEYSRNLCFDDDCAICYNESFANVPMCKYWDYKKNKETPRTITKFSHKKAWFICQNNHKFESIIYSVSKGTWCSECICKSETICREIIEKLTGKKYPKKRLDCLNKYELDGYCKELNLAFEYQGQQHYRYYPDFFHNKGKHTFLEQLLRDEIKKRLCTKNDINLIIIPYTEIKEEYIKQKLIELNIKIYL